MNTEQLFKNLGHVKTEARGMLDNIRAVRGDKHALLTSGLLHSSTLTDVARMLVNASMLDEEVKERVKEVYLHCLSETVRCLVAAGGHAAEEIDSAIAEAMSVENTVGAMAQAAVTRAEEGKPYGDA